MRKILLITAVFMAMSAWSEPSEWVAKELIKKPVTYMSIGLHICNSKFADNDNTNYPLVGCSYSWDANRLEFSQSIRDPKVTKKDYGYALSQCKKLIHPYLDDFIQGLAFQLIFMNLDGFNPDGYGYKDSKRDEKFEEFVKRSLVSVILLQGLGTTDAWQCDWKYRDKEPSLKWRSLS